MRLKLLMYTHNNIVYKQKTTTTKHMLIERESRF